jgi:O-antigen/teichoic acid export membrane protein
MLKYFKEQLEQGKTFLSFTVPSIAGQVLGMAVPLIVAEWFAPELFASFSLSRTVLFLFTGLFIASAEKPFIVYANEELAGSGKINRSFSIRLMLTSASIIIYLTFAAVFCKPLMLFTELSAQELIFMSLAFCGLALKDFTASLFLGLNERLKNAIVELIYGLSSVVLIVIFYLANNLNIKTVFLVYLLAALIVAMLSALMINYKMLLPLVFDKELFRKIIDFTKWAILGAAAVYLVNWGDNFVLKLFHVPMNEIGIYNFGSQFFKGFTLLTLVINSYFLPFITQNLNNKEKIRNYLYSKRPKIMMLVLACSVIIFFAAPYIDSFHGAGYKGSGTILRMLLPGVALTGYNLFYVAIFLAVKEYKYIQVFGMVQAAFNLGFDLLLVPMIGIKGAAIATIIGYCANVAMFEIYFRLKIKRQVT